MIVPFVLTTFVFFGIGFANTRVCQLGGGFRCPSTGNCLDNHLLCDGIPDCFGFGYDGLAEDESHEFAGCSNSVCPVRDKRLVIGRRCPKPCKKGSDCRGLKKKCVCDGHCGKSCFNPVGTCSTPPMASGALSLTVYRMKRGAMRRAEDNTYLVGDFVSYKCPVGYEAHGPEIRCTSKRKWTRGEVACILSCPSDAAKVQRYGLVCGSDCLTNANCPGTLQCLCDGPCGRTCVDTDRTCSVATPLANTYVEYSGTGYKRLAHYLCNPGFYPRSGDNTHACCASSGRFYGENLVCEEVVCGNPDSGYRQLNLVAIHISDIRFRFNSTVTFRCLSGYAMNGPATHRCLADGQWSRPQTTCTRISALDRECPDPGLPVGGQRHGEDFGVNSTVRFTCDSGYAMMGSTLITCLDSLEWNDRAPICSDPRFGRRGLKALRRLSMDVDLLPVPRVGSGERSIDLSYEHGLQIIMLIDCSKSINNLEFEKLIGFAEGLVKMMEVYKKEVSFGIIGFASKSISFIDLLNAETNVTFVLEKLKEIEKQKIDETIEKKLGLGTNTYKAMEHLRQNLSLSFRVDNSSKRHVLVFTDGRHNIGKSPIIMKNIIQNQHGDLVEFYSISSCKECRQSNQAIQELRQLASNEDNYIHIDSYYLLHKSLDKAFNLTGDYSRCGIAGDDDSISTYGARIVGGQVVKRSWPWQAVFFRAARAQDLSRESTGAKAILLGGGSLINDRWILTAAHVAVKMKMNLQAFVIALGLFEIPKKWKNHLPVTKFYRPGDLRIHENYEDPEDYDIALIRLGDQLRIGRKGIFEPKVDGYLGVVKFSPYIRPVCLPCLGSCTKSSSLGKSGFGPKCQEEGAWLLKKNAAFVVTGFGHNSTREPHEKNIKHVRKLQQAQLKIWPDQKCRALATATNHNYTERQICASNRNSRGQVVDSCQGDSGGPLVRKCTENNTGKTCWVQVGIVNRGHGCGYTDPKGNVHPGYYTNVHALIGWIQSKINMTGNDWHN